MDNLYFFQKCLTSFGKIVEKDGTIWFNVGKGKGIFLQNS